jgi:hypothetical protein
MSTVHPYPPDQDLEFLSATPHSILHFLSEFYHYKKKRKKKIDIISKIIDKK